MIVIEQNDLFPDEGNRSLIEAAVESDGSVFLHLSKGPLTEEIFQMGRGWPQTL
jgi:hypothetical protein